MKKLAFLLVAFVSVAFGVDTHESTQDSITQSSLYKKWQENWGDYEWSNNVIGNKHYAFESAYTIIDMIDKDDIVGLEHIYKSLKDKEPNMASLNGIVGEPTFEKEAIDKASFKALEFLLNNGIVKIDVIIIDVDAGKEYSLSEFATQKLQEAKAKGDSKAIANYEKILEILKE